MVFQIFDQGTWLVLFPDNNLFVFKDNKTCAWNAFVHASCVNNCLQLWEGIEKGSERKSGVDVLLWKLRM